MKVQSSITFAVVSVLTLGGAAWAAEKIISASESKETFRMLDSDGDGFVSTNEAVKMKGLPENFGAVDSNSDGKLVLAELEVYLAGRKN